MRTLSIDIDTLRPDHPRQQQHLLLDIQRQQRQVHNLDQAGNSRSE
jgi:hypothetical protein